MQKSILVLVVLILSIYPAFIMSQEKLQPFVVSPFIGDKLDRVEEEYFKIFPNFTDFQEAEFYVNTDSSLNVKIKVWHKNTLVDTTIRHWNSTSYLKGIIDQRIWTDINQGKVKELTFTTNKDSIIAGTVYAYENKQITFIQEGFNEINGEKDREKYLQKLNYFGVDKITVNETGYRVSAITGTIGFIAGGMVAFLIAPKDNGSSSFYGMNFNTLETFGIIIKVLIGGAIGWVMGFLIGLPFEYPVDYHTNDPEAENILYENALLKK